MKNLHKKILNKTANMQEWIAWETRKRKTDFWCEEYEIEPVIAAEKVGDGKQLIYIGTIDQRPHYWLIRIDSKTDINADLFNIEKYIEILEEEFGQHPENFYDLEDFEEAKKNYCGFENFENYEDYLKDCEYPAVWWGGGHYGSLFTDN